MPAPKDPEKRREWIANLRASAKKYWGDLEARKNRSGENSPNYGKHLSVETIEKQRKANLGEKNPNFGKDFSGKKGPAFKGGVGKGGYHWTRTSKLEARVRDRDNQTCQVCGEIWVEGERKFDTHHIYGSEDNDQPCDLTRLITLCRKCHKKVNVYFADYVSQFEIIVNQECVWCGT